MPPDRTTTSISGQKRSADDGFDPFISPLNLKATPPYDIQTQEQSPHAVIQSKEYNTYKSLEQQVEQLLTEPPSKFGYTDKYIQGVLDLVRARIGGRKKQNIILCITGPMGMGA